MPNASFIDDFTRCIDKVHVHFDNIIVIGDLNYDLVKPDKSQPLHTVCDIFDFTNLIKTPTCFMKDAPPSMLDVILTNRPSLLFNITNSTCGISDWHNMISCVIKGAAPPPKKNEKLSVAHTNISMRGSSVRQWVSSLLMLLMFLMTWMTSTGLMKSSSPMF
ncbi:hypothetical protein NP493_493g01000 [Ridgeia piscesae]|uniref:Endonuclease/exonuclease/phosphatase domain-containing protein n=1 Tax=Ridgeia piscesae TaxID=27915 RepID=A0AAD9KXB0_RIDPI|nr:hypothetical protein NP493_493g01000 [Ridgeia piscesae]